MKKILLIDDDLAILEAVAILLQDAGYQVETSENGDYLDGLIDRSRKFPDMIILDVLLSGRDGRDLVKALKTNEETKKIPILMISAHPSAEESISKAGADGFLPKPFEVEDLLNKVKSYI